MLLWYDNVSGLIYSWSWDMQHGLLWWTNVHSSPSWLWIALGGAATSHFPDCEQRPTQAQSSIGLPSLKRCGGLLNELLCPVAKSTLYTHRAYNAIRVELPPALRSTWSESTT